MRFILCFLLALCAAPTWADWVKVGWFDNGDSEYIDPDKIRKNGNLRRVWQIHDQEQNNSGMIGKSQRGLFEYDCKVERYRSLSITGHSEPMAKGVIIFSYDNPSDWHFIPPNTIVETILKRVCFK